MMIFARAIFIYMKKKKWKKNKRNFSERSKTVKTARRELTAKMAAAISLDKETQEKPLKELLEELLK